MTNMEWKLVLLYVVAATVLTSALGERRSHPGIEADTFTFHFDPDTNLFVGMNKFTCILVYLNAEEREEVHTTRGIERIELRMIKDWMGVLPEVMVYRTDPLLSPHVVHWCYDRNIIMLQRHLKGTTTTSGHAYTTTTGTPSTTSGRISNSLWSKVSTRSTEIPSSPSMTSSGGTMATSSTSETTIGTTTTDLPASATSHHPAKATEQTVFAPFIIYDNSLSLMNAVIVDKGNCYVYSLSDMEIKMVDMGQAIKEAFEKVLLDKDRTNATMISRSVYENSDKITRSCTGKIFQLN